MKHRCTNFLSNLVDLRSVGKVCEPLKVPRLPAKTEVRQFVLRLALDWRFRATFERQVGPGPAVLGTFERQDGLGPAVLGTLERQVGPGLAVLAETSVWGTRRKG